MSALFGQDPRNQYRMQLAQSLMSDQTPVKGPWTGLASVGSKLAGAFLARSALKDADAERKATVEALQGMGAGSQFAPFLQSNVPGVQAMGAQALMASMLKGQDPESFGAPTTVMGPDGKPTLVQPGNRGTIRPVIGFAPKPDETKTQVAGGLEKDPATGQWRPIPGYREQQESIRRAGKTDINVNPSTVYTHTEGAASKKLYEGLGDRIEGLRKSADEAASYANQVKLLNQTLGEMDTDAATDWRARIQSWAKAAGVDVDQAALATVEGARNIAGGLVMQQLNAMKGPATEKEREYLERISPQITTSPQGRELLQYIAEHQAARLAKVNEYADVLSDDVASGAITVGQANRELRQFMKQAAAEADSQFQPPTMTPAAPAAAGAPQKPPAPGGLKTISSDAEYEALPSGAEFIGPDGKRRRKP